MGAILSVPTPKVGWTFMVYDPHDRTDDYWPDRLFSDGVSVSVSAKIGGLVRGRTSSATLTGNFSTVDSLDLREILLPPEVQTGVKDNIWNANLVLAHFLRESKPGAGDGWGIFGRIGISDGNPNPFQKFFSGGIGGKGLFTSRPDDTFGLGYFNCNFSDELQSALSPLVELKDEQGFEFFYDYALSPDARLAVDLQFVDPAIGDADDAFVGGLRLRFRF